jgi:toxin ParE1/3/4
MTGYLLSPAAQTDLQDIWDYTVGEWGEARAERYVLAIRAACEAVAARQREGRPIDDIRSGYRKLAVRSHFLFYRMTGRGQIDIVRVLHQRMDAPGRLASDNLPGNDN